MNIDLELFKVFYYVAVSKNLTKASGKMHISQPAITKHIKKLEEELKNPLFIRTKRGVILTEFGEKIFEQVSNMIKSIQNIDNLSSSFSMLETGTIKIGTGKSLTKTFIIPIMKKIKEKYPNVHVEFEIYSTEILMKKLKSGEIDFIFSKFPENRDDALSYLKLGELHDIFICNKELYNEIGDRVIRLSELKQYQLLLPQNVSMSRKHLDTLLKNNSLNTKTDMEIGSLSLIAKFVEEGFGIGIATKEYIKDLLDMNVLYEIKTNPSFNKMDFGIITLSNMILSPISKKFIEMLKTEDF